MMIQAVMDYLSQVEMLPELREALRQMVIVDAARLEQNTHLGVIQALQRILGLNPEHSAPFAVAWSLMFMATSRLDHLQDGDPVTYEQPPGNHLGAHYNLVFSYYVLATGVLDTLSPQHIPTARIARLRQVWSHAMLRMASGQQRDLLSHHAALHHEQLASYQELAQAKTGAAFALAFGGVAIIATDDDAWIEALMTVGELYGALLQYSDDIRDRSTQPHANTTLPGALALTSMHEHAHKYTLIDFLAHVQRAYREAAEHELRHVSSAMRESMLQVFDQLIAPC